VPREVLIEVAKLAGKQTGLGETSRQLALDPCNLGAPNNLSKPKAYRLSGPLQPVVCGTHLRRGYRLAFTVRDNPDAPGGKQIVVLYVGKKNDPGYEGDNDMWDLVHNLFGVENPEDGHLKPPCCGKDWPNIDDDALDDFLERLRALQRGR